MTVEDFLTEWGAEYGSSMKEATENDLFEDMLQYTLVSTSNKCVLDGFNVTIGGPNNLTMTPAEIVTEALDEVLEKLYFPANNYYYYIDAMLSSYVPDAGSSDFSKERLGFPTGTIVIVS